MPSRLLREGILTSDRVNLLTASEEVFYRRLMSKVDDHGLFDARLEILRSGLYPLRVEKVRLVDLGVWLAACVRAELLQVYEIAGKRYGQMLDTRWHARSDPKFPLPSTDGATVISCEQLKTPVPVVVVRSRCTESSIGASASGPQVCTDARALEDGFQDFWDAYPRKVHKADALKAWRKLQPDRTRVSQILHAVAEQVTQPQWTKDGGQFIPYPSSWLNGRRWEDQPTSAAKPAAVSALEAKLLGTHGA